MSARWRQGSRRCAASGAREEMLLPKSCLAWVWIFFVLVRVWLFGYASDARCLASRIPCGCAAPGDIALAMQGLFAHDVFDPVPILVAGTATRGCIGLCLCADATACASLIIVPDRMRCLMPRFVSLWPGRLDRSLA